MPTNRPKRPFPCSRRFDEAFALFNVCCETNLGDLFHINRKTFANHRQIIAIITILMLLIDTTAACGPGRGGGRRRSPRKLTPLVFKQHVPNVSENTLGASGLREGKITREDQRFRELVPNYNSDIVFKDEEGTGADRLMTQRLKEKLNTLAISVMNQWPGVKLRVTEGWDEEGHHAIDSLHYEGRAVDITTSDRDRSKYGMLARLAVEAGFDWVYYESRFHIHVSVKSEKSDAGRSGGCFDGRSLVNTRTGIKRIDELRVGEEVLSINANGQLVFSEVIMFLDRQPNISRLYYRIDTENGETISLTESHLIYISDSDASFDDFVPAFARNARVGQYLYTLHTNASFVKSERIIAISTGIKTGAFAPLTNTGTILVNHVLASCYAVIDDQRLAHISFLPIRLWTNFVESMQYMRSAFNWRSQQWSRKNSESVVQVQDGVHWYPRMLYSIAKRIISSDKLY